MNRTTKQGVGVAAAFAVAWVMGTGCAFLGEKETDKVISMNELPPTVRSLAEKEVVGCKIIEVEQEMKDGKVIYAITYDQAGTKMELEYAPDGKLISKGKE